MVKKKFDAKTGLTFPTYSMNFAYIITVTK